MFKQFALLTKRDGLSTAEFIDYYENHHVPLVLGLTGMPHRVYKRHFVIRDDDRNQADQGVDFDVVTEVAFDDRESYDAWLAAVGEHGAEVAADEAKFLDRSRTRVVLVEDHVSAG